MLHAYFYFQRFFGGKWILPIKKYSTAYSQISGVGVFTQVKIIMKQQQQVSIMLTRTVIKLMIMIILYSGYLRQNRFSRLVVVLFCRLQKFEYITKQIFTSVHKDPCTFMDSFVLAFCIHIVYYHSNDYDNYYDYDYFDVKQVCLGQRGISCLALLFLLEKTEEQSQRDLPDIP